MVWHTRCQMRHQLTPVHAVAYGFVLGRRGSVSQAQPEDQLDFLGLTPAKKMKRYEWMRASTDCGGVHTRLMAAYTRAIAGRP